MTRETYYFKESIAFDIGKKLREKFNIYLHDASVCGFNDEKKHSTVLLFFHTDDMKDQAKSSELVSDIEEFCLKELSQVELEELRTYGIRLICDSHENVVRTNGGNYLMYRR